MSVATIDRLSSFRLKAWHMGCVMRERTNHTKEKKKTDLIRSQLCHN